MKHRTRLFSTAWIALLLLGMLGLTACSSTPETTTPPAEEQPAEEQAAPPAEENGMYTPEYKPNGKETAVFKTSKGDIVVELYGNDAPIHVGNFVELVRTGFYNDTKFHRYEPGFVIQGGDPQSKDLTSDEVISEVQSGMSNLGTGGPGYTIKAEYDPAVNPNKHVKGALGMARSQAPDSAGSQFYFALEPLTMLDGQYTVFGVITEGLDVMSELRVGDVIESVEIRGAE